jgi:putative intracellular protease/amidase
MGSGAVDSEAVEIVKQAVAMGKPLAAQSGAIRTLAEAGVLKGRNYAFPYDPLNLHLQPRDAKFEGAIYKKDIIVKDGKIITSCCSPSTESAWFSQDATVELTRALIDELIPK